MRGVFPAGLVVLLLALPGAVAGGVKPVAGDLTFHTPPHYEGSAVLTGPDAVLDLSPALEGGEALRISWARAIGWQVYTNATVLFPPTSLYVGHPSGNVSQAFEAGQLQDVQCGLSCKVYVVGLGDEGTDVGISGATNGAILPTAQTKTFWAVVEREGAANAFYHEVPAGGYAASARVASQANAFTDGMPHARGRLGLLLLNVTGVVQVGEERIVIDTLSRAEPVVNPAGGVVGKITRSSHVFLVLEDAEVALAAGSAAVVYAPAPARLELDGALSAASASGSLDFGDDQNEVRRQPVRIEGFLSTTLGTTGDPSGPGVAADPLFPSREARGEIRGEARSVRIAGVEVVESDSSAVVTGGLTLAAVAAAVLLFLNRAPLLAAFYSRISRSRILSNPRRQQIYDIVAQQPGVTATELSTATGLARVVVQHHLRMLETHQMVTVRPNGRRRAYYLIGEVPAGEQLHGQAALRDESRRKIAEAILASAEPMTQNSLSEGTGLSQRLVSYHLSHLQERGLVHSEGSQPRRYRPTDLLASLLRGDSDNAQTKGGGVA